MPPPAADARATLLLVVSKADVNLYPGHQFTRIAAESATAAIQQLIREPRFVVIDWELDGVNGAELCRAAVAARAMVVVTSGNPADAPAALRAGCHAILLKPLTPMLIAARLGRLTREAARGRPSAGHASVSFAHRVTPETECPYCAVTAPVSFEFCSHRRAWYACLSCDSVWLGARFE